MVSIEPELKALFEKAKAYKPVKNFCANQMWHGRNGLKQELCRLVGFGAKNFQLRTSEAYDLAYCKIYNALPDCQHDGRICC